jgi:hypothetical protein
MLKKYFKLEFVFFLTGFFIFIYRSLFIHTNLDINYHGSVINLNSLTVTVIFMTLFAFLGLPYLILRNIGTPMYKIMGWMHYLLTMLPWLVIAMVHPLVAVFFTGENINTIDADIYKYSTVMIVAVLLFMSGQLVFFLNIILTLFRRVNE